MNIVRTGTRKDGSKVAEIVNDDGSTATVPILRTGTGKDGKRVAEVEINGARSLATFSDGQPSISSDSKWKRTVSDAAHTYLPPIAATIGSAGAIIAGQLGPQIATPEEALTVPAAGAGGWAIGEQGADVIDSLLGTGAAQEHRSQQDPSAIPQPLRQAGQNVYRGVEAEALGIAAGPLLRGVGQGASYLKRSLIPGEITAKGAERRAGDILRENVGNINTTSADETIQRVPGLRGTAGMAGNNRAMMQIERGMDKQAPGVAGQLDEMQQGNVAAIREKTRTISKGNPEDFRAALDKEAAEQDRNLVRLGQGTRQEAGNKILDVVEAEKEPVRKAMESLEGQIPNYGMRADNLTQKLTEISQTTMTNPEAKRDALKKAAELYKLSGNSGGQATTHGIVAFRRGLNDAISKAEGTEQALLISIKEAADNDLAVLGDMAKKGKIATYQGRQIDTAKLADEYAKNLESIAAGKDGEFDWQNAAAALYKKTGASYVRPGVDFKDQAGEITRDFNRHFPGVAMPMKEGGGQLSKRNAEIKTILDRVEPGKDAQAAVRAYNDYASREWFGRFKTGATAQATRAGQQASGLSMRTENVANQYMTETGIDDLLRLVKGDRVLAKETIRPAVNAELAEFLGKNPSDQAINQFIASKKTTLGKLGMMDEVAAIANRQKGYNELRRILRTDTNKIFDQILSGNRNAQRAEMGKVMALVKGNEKAVAGLRNAFAENLERNLVKDLSGGRQSLGNIENILKSSDGAIDVLFAGDATGRQAIKDIRDAVILSQRINLGSSTGGSATNELFNAQRLLAGRNNQISNVATGLVTGGIAGMTSGNWLVATTAGGTGTALSAWASKTAEENVKKVLARAMFDPAVAKALIGASRSRETSKEAIKVLTDKLARLGVYATYPTLNQEKQP